MQKQFELSDPGSHLNRAHPDEPLFILMGRDPATAPTIHFWVRERLRLGLNGINDPQYLDALYIAEQMKAWLQRSLTTEP